MKIPRIAIIGETQVVDGDVLTRSGAIALALRMRGDVEVTFRAVSASSHQAAHITDLLTRAGITPMITVRQGEISPRIGKGDTLDIWGLFAHDIVILDFDDAPLRHFLTDLPAHTDPSVRLLGTLDYVTSRVSLEERQIALRFDALVGTWQQAIDLVGESGEENHPAVSAFHHLMRGANLRAAIIHSPSYLEIAELDEPLWSASSNTMPDSAAIVAGVAIGMSRRDSWPSIGAALIAPNDTISERHPPILRR